MTTTGDNSSLRALDAVPLRVDAVYTRLREAILKLQLRPGEALVERRLAEALNTSKTPVREALVRLEHDGLVVGAPYRGFSVAPLSLHDAWEILQLRSVLEGLAAREACSVMSPADIAEAAGHLDQAGHSLRAGDNETAVELGHEMHRAIFYQCQNKRLISSIDRLSAQFHRVRLLSAGIPARLEKAQEEHRRIIEALRSADPELLEQRVRAHLLAVYDDLEASYTGWVESPRGTFT